MKCLICGPPIKVIGKYGDSVIRVNDCYESCQMYMDDGVSPVDFLRLWKMESSAICSGRRKRGILATQIVRNHEGKWGCVVGWLVYRVNDYIAICDAATIGFKESEGTFDLAPKDWWKCVRAKSQRLDHVWKVPIASFLAWNDRIHGLISATVCTHDLIQEERMTRLRNGRIVERVLHGIKGGEELYRRFPSDYMSRLSLITNAIRKRCYNIGGSAGVHEFDEDLYPKRNVDMLKWWMKNQIASSGATTVAFLNHVDCRNNHVAISMISPTVGDAARFSEMLKSAKILSQGIDYVAFATRQSLNGCVHKCMPMIMTRRDFRLLLDSATSVLLGICNGTAWATFSLVKQSLQFEPFWAVRSTTDGPKTPTVTDAQKPNWTKE